MAKLEQGILGPFRGKIGTVVGYLWRGRPVVRAYRRQINYPNTERQQAERDWFVSMVRFAATARQALLLGLREQAALHHMTEGNLFLKINKTHFRRDVARPHPCRDVACHVRNASANPPRLRNASTHPCNDMSCLSPTVDYKHIKFSDGPVAPVASAAWHLDERQTLTATWQRRTPLPRCKADDNVHLYIYNARSREGILAAPTRRASGSTSLALPDHWNPEDLHLYLFATDAQGLASLTSYATSDTVPCPAPDDNGQTRSPHNTPEHNSMKTTPNPIPTSPASPPTGRLHRRHLTNHLSHDSSPHCR